MTMTRHKGRVMVSLLALQTAACHQLSLSDCEAHDCIPAFGKCGGSFFNVSGSCCDDGSLCVVKNFWFAQCLTEDWAAVKVAQGWDGSLLDCEQMPLDVSGGPNHDMAPASTPDLDDFDCEDDECANGFEQCGGGYNTSTLCCDPDMECVVKNWFYAQCLPETNAAHNVGVEDWDGRLLHCEEMPNDAPKSPTYWGEKDLSLEEVDAKIDAEVQNQDDTHRGPFTKFELAPSEAPGRAPIFVPRKTIPVKAGGPKLTPIRVVPVPQPAPAALPEPQAPDTPIAQPPMDVEEVAPPEEPEELTRQPKEPEAKETKPPQAVPPPAVDQPVDEPPAGDQTISKAPSEEPPAAQPFPEPEPATSGPVDADFTQTGDLTYYGGAGIAGHCTQSYVPEGFTTVALNAPQYASGAACGTCLYACFNNLELAQGERCFQAIVDDECPECKSGDLDLGENGSGRWPVDWQIIRCPDAPRGLIFSTQGSNPYYAKVKAEGGPSSVASMTCNGLPGVLTPDAFFVFMSSVGEFACGMDCEVSFSNGFGTGTGQVTPTQLGGLCN